MWSHPGMPLLGDIGFPQAYSDLLLIDTTAFRTPNGFRTVALSPNGQAVLKERIAPLELTLLHDTVYTRTTTTDEYINLWERPATDRTAAVLCVDIDALLTTEQTAPAVVLAVECDDKNGAHPHYESLELSRVRGTWRRDTLRVARRIPPITPGITRTVVYLWNIDKQPVTVERCRVRVYSIVP